MITLSLKDSGTALGTIDEGDLRLLIDQLEEENRNDTDDFICSAMIEVLGEKGASPGLIHILTDAVGDSEGVEISWERA